MVYWIVVDEGSLGCGERKGIWLEGIPGGISFGLRVARRMCYG
jgi:hypothetical protein